MVVKDIAEDKFKELLLHICDKDTAAEMANWTEENPLAGHCLVVSLVAQKLFGGDIMSASLDGVPEFSYIGRHFVNRLPDGRIEDFAKEQFGDRYPTGLKFKVKKRNGILYNEQTGKPKQVMRRYRKLSYRLAGAANGNSPLFDDPVYQECFYQALESPCQKMGFGVVVKRGGETVYKGCNDQAIEELKHMCEPTCIRLNIQSRTEQMLGACSHAEELVIKHLAKERIPIDECEIYIAGVYSNGLPWIKEAPEHTCLRCSTQMYNAGFKKIYVPMADGWKGITRQEAVNGAVAYATKQKKA